MTPTISDRDFVIATVAAPTVVKELEKPAAEGEAVEGAEGAAAAEGGGYASTSKEGEQAKKDEKSKDAGAEKNLLKKKLQIRKHLKRNNFMFISWIRKSWTE